MKALKEALMKKRQKGLDLTIIIGSGHEPKEGLLPMKPEHALPSHLPSGPADEEQDRELIQDELAKAESLKDKHPVQDEMGEAQDEHELDDASMKKDLLDSMSEHEKMDLQHRKPRSLSERVRQAALHKK